MSLAQARRVLEIEIKALEKLARDLDQRFEQVVKLLVETRGRIILTGMGKSGIIARKISATLASTGSPAFFLHPAEAIHGDLGMVVSGDTVIAISNSGETQELVQLLEHIKRNGAKLIALSGKEESTLVRFADAAIIFTIEEEGCPLGLAPMASTTTTLALGDAIAAAVMETKGFTSKEFARFHPGGKLGLKLQTVGDMMKQHQGRPLVEGETTLSQALIEMSDKRLGMTAVSLEKDKIGLISDGDIRRLLLKHGHSALEMKARDVCTPNPKVIHRDRLAAEALNILETNKITSILVRDDDSAYIGVVHLHDLWQTKLV